MLDDALFNAALPRQSPRFYMGNDQQWRHRFITTTASALQSRGLVDLVIDHQDQTLVAAINQAIETQLAALEALPAPDLIEQREAKFQHFLQSWPVN